MSHFSVLVFTKELPTQDLLERTLLPWHQYECTGYNDYIQFVPAEETEQFLRVEYEENKNYGSFKKFLWECYEYEIVDGIIGCHTNPNAKWDWWMVGGRWRNSLINLDGFVEDYCKISDLNMPAMQAMKKEERERYWDESLDKSPDIRHFVYGIKEGITREDYINQNKALGCFAFVVDGTWNEKGEMGWFACVNDEKSDQDWDTIFWKAFNKIPKNYYVTVVDCHI